MKYFFIINGRREKTANYELMERQIDNAKSYLERRGDSMEVYWTTGVGDGTRKVRIYSDLHPDEKVCFIACGGDRTIGEVASGLVGFCGKSMAVYKFGETGNDFIKSFPGYDFQDVQAIFDGEERMIDIMKINDSYAINVGNVGFEAAVGRSANELIETGKKNPYIWGIFRAVLTSRYNGISVVADGEKLGGKKLLGCTFGNGKYVGDGFCCTPRAEMDDGLIDVCLVKPMSLFRFSFLPAYYQKGSHVENEHYKNKIVYRKVRHIDIESEKMTELCLDGEMLPGTKFSVDIIPRAINFILPHKN